VLISLLSVRLESTHSIKVSLKLDKKHVETQVACPQDLHDLIIQIRMGKGTNKAIQHLSCLLGSLVFADEVGQLLRTLISPPKQKSNNLISPSLYLIVQSDSHLQDWPWELTADPQNQQFLTFSGVEWIRGVYTAKNTLPDLQPVGQVIMTPNERFKYNAVKAATSTLRKQNQLKLDAFSDLQHSLSTPHLLSHLFAVDAQGYLKLSRPRIAVSESTTLHQAYLLNVTPELLPSVHEELIQKGTWISLGRQFDLSPKETAEVDRAFYHALGSGATLGQALHTARYTLYQSNPHMGKWASLFLTCTLLPQLDQSPAFIAFPPPSLAIQSKASSSSSLSGSSSIHGSKNTSKTLQVGFVGAPSTPFAQPNRVNHFVHDTVRLVQHSQQSDQDQDKVALAVRTAAMKQLSALAQGQPTQQGSNRTQQLTQQLVQAGLFEDQDLHLPQEWMGLSQGLAQTLGIRFESIAQVVQTLMMSKGIWVHGTDSTTRLKLIRGICQGIFQTYPFEFDGNAVLVPDFFTDDQREHAGLNGALWEACQLAWKEEESKPLDVTCLRPTVRSQIVAFNRQLDAWKLFKSPCLVIDQAHLTSVDQRYRLLKGLQEGVLQGYTESGRPLTLHIPQDLRVIYLSESAPQFNQGEVIHTLKLDLFASLLSWLYNARGRLTQLGLADYDIEARVNQSECESFSRLIHTCYTLLNMPVHLCLDALTYGLFHGGQVVHYLESFDVYIRPYLKTASEQEIQCIQAYSLHKQDDFEALWTSLNRTEACPPLPQTLLSPWS
jgi:hypothetical protein